VDSKVLKILLNREIIVVQTVTWIDEAFAVLKSAPKNSKGQIPKSKQNQNPVLGIQHPFSPIDCKFFCDEYLI
jgi:hypothetical protein